MAGVLTFSVVCANLVNAEPDKVMAAENTPVRVDINSGDGRQGAYSLTYDNWILKADTTTATFGGLKFTLSNGGTTGGAVNGKSYKGLIKDDGTTPRLTMDGALITDATDGGIIKLEISGLSEGTHTLTTWHSFWDLVEGSTMSVYVDGELKVEHIKSVTRVTNDLDAGIGYCEFEAKKDKTVTVLIKPDGNGKYNNAILNAFEIDSTNEKPQNVISVPYPADGERHFVQGEKLSWKPGNEAVSHNVYFGSDYESVKNATTSSEEFMGNQTENTFEITQVLSHMEKYYWRVDEVDSEGNISHGEVMSFEVAHLAFPSAEGYGRFARGGRGGRVIEVTNLNDSGPGSLRDAIENQKGPRIIVFKVGGVIELQSRLSIPADGGDVYVAGQTAPGDGITLTKYAFGIYYAKDVIIRDVRLRVGDSCGISMDGMGMAGADHSIIDHCSIAWTTDEGTSSRGAHNITFQHNLIAEALNNSVHYDADNRDNTEKHSFAGSISGNIGSYHHNLLVNCTGRNWSLAGGLEQDGKTYGGQLDVRNNVVYNYRDRTTDGGVRRINFVNNYYKQGAVSKDMAIFSIDGDELNTGDMQMAYLSGNKMVKKDGTVILDSNEDTWTKAKCKFDSISDVRSDVPFFESYVKTETADEAYESVLDNVGANVPKQDYLDTRYITETRTGTYTYTGSRDKLKGIIDSQEDVGGYPKLSGGVAPKDTDHDGMPDEWEILHGLNPNYYGDRNGMQLSLEGYTNLEMYLDELAGDAMLWNENPDLSEYEGLYEIPETSEPEISGPGVEVTGGQGEVTGGQSEVTGGQSEVTGGQSEVTGGQSEVTGGQSEVTGGQSEVTGGQGGVTGGGSEVTGGQSEVTGDQSGVTGGGSEVTADVGEVTGDVGGVTEGIGGVTEGGNGATEGVGVVTGDGNGADTGELLFGDVNYDNRINLLDAKIVLKVSLGIKVDKYNFKAANVNKDTKIDLKDAKIVLKKALGILVDEI